VRLGLTAICAALEGPPPQRVETPFSRPDRRSKGTLTNSEGCRHPRAVGHGVEKKSLLFRGARADYHALAYSISTKSSGPTPVRNMTERSNTQLSSRAGASRGIGAGTKPTPNRPAFLVFRMIVGIHATELPIDSVDSKALRYFSGHPLLRLWRQPVVIPRASQQAQSVVGQLLPFIHHHGGYLLGFLIVVALPAACSLQRRPVRLPLCHPKRP